MKTTTCSLLLTTTGVLALTVLHGFAQDWPQWRGPNRDAHATFNAPATWPKEMSPKWKTTVGDGVATPALVGEKLFVFARQEGAEVLYCLSAATGEKAWAEKYEALAASGPAASFPGPRCSPTVADGKIITLGVRGALCCREAASGKLLWRKDDFQNSLPRFFTSGSPLIAEGLCVALVGGPDNGGIIAYDLATGDHKWEWTGNGPAYASPALLTIAGTKYVVAMTDTKVVALTLSAGKLVWEVPFVVQGRGYNASSPIVDGDVVIYTGSSRGTTAVKLEQSNGGLTAKELWKNAEASAMFGSPVLVKGAVYCVGARNDLFCLNAADGKMAWTTSFSAGQPAEAPGGGAGGDRPRGGPGGDRPGGGPGGGGMRGGGMRGGGGGYGSIVDAGSVLLALTPASQLLVFQPNEKSFTETARIKVGSSPTYAYPVAAGKRIFIKDQDSVMLYTVE